MSNNKLKLKKSIFLMLIILALLIIPGNMSYLNHGYLSGFMVQNWSISYDTGFVLRGLPGTVMSALFNPISSKEVMYAVYVMIAAYVSFIFISIRKLYQLNNEKSNLVFILFLLVQPSVLQRWISSSVIGRLDSLLAVLFLSVIFIVLKSKRTYLKYALANLLTIIAILSHEGFAVFFVPTIFATILIKERKILKPALAYLAPSFAVWILTVIFGGADVPQEQFMMMLKNNAVTNPIYPFEPDKVKMIYYMTLGEKIKFTLNYYNNTKIAHIILTFILMSPSIICFVGYWRSIIKCTEDKKQKHMLLFLSLAALSPLISMVFAIDTYRWIGWAMFNSSAALAILFFMSENYRKAIISYTKSNTLKLVFATTLALLLGYFTVFSPYPIIVKYFPAIYQFFLG